VVDYKKWMELGKHFSRLKSVEKEGTSALPWTLFSKTSRSISSSNSSNSQWERRCRLTFLSKTTTGPPCCRIFDDPSAISFSFSWNPFPCRGFFPSLRRRRHHHQHYLSSPRRNIRDPCPRQAIQTRLWQVMPPLLMNGQPWKKDAAAAASTPANLKNGSCILCPVVVVQQEEEKEKTMEPLHHNNPVCPR